MSTVLQFVGERFLYSHEEEQYYTLHPRKRQRTTSSGLVSSLKSERNIFSRLFVASQFRDGNLTRINHVHHHGQPEGNSKWAPNLTVFDA